MRILLTGASGQVGGALNARLADHEVIAPDRGTFDLEQAAGIGPFVDRVRPQLIINCAAYTAVDEAEREAARAAQINGVAPGLLARAARDAGAGIIHFSTDYVFDGIARTPYRETDRCAPINAYGRSKWQGEQAIAAASGNALIIRTSWVYGPTGRNFLRSMLRLGAERTTLQVVDDQTGSPTSALMLADMVARIVQQMGRDPNDYLQRHGGTLHAACAGETTWHGFAAAIFEEARRRGGRLVLERLQPITTAQYPTAARRPAYSVLDLARLRQEFGIAPPPWRDALAQVFDRMPAA